MATKASRAAETWTYVLAVDREIPVEQQSRFVLRPLTIGERARANDLLVSTMENADGSRERILREHSLALQLVTQNVVAIENFPSDQPMAWPDGRAERLTYLEALRDTWVIELGNEIWGRSQLEDAVKNS